MNIFIDLYNFVMNKDEHIFKIIKDQNGKIKKSNCKNTKTKKKINLCHVSVNQWLKRVNSVIKKSQTGCYNVTSHPNDLNVFYLNLEWQF